MGFVMTAIKGFQKFLDEGATPAVNVDPVAEGEPLDGMIPTEPVEIPALFATIHHRSDERPDGFAPEDIEDLNGMATKPQTKEN